MTLVDDETSTREAFTMIEKLEEVASTLNPDSDDHAKLLTVLDWQLRRIGTVRPRVAATLLNISEKTIRAWVHEGVLIKTADKPRLLLDAGRVHEVLHLVRDLRKIGRNRNLIDALWHRLSDHAILERADLHDSLEQMRRGQGRVLHPRSDETSKSV